MTDAPSQGSGPAPAVPQDPIGGAVLRRVGWLHFVNDLSLEFLTPLLPGVLGPAWIGVMEGAADGLAQALKLVSGRASDRSGSRAPWVRAGYLVNAIARPLAGLGMLLAAPILIVACRISDRIGKGIRGSATDALVADWAPEGERAVVFARMRTMDHLGATLGALAAAAAAWLLPLGRLWMPVLGLVVATLWVVGLTTGLRDRALPQEPAGSPLQGWWPSSPRLRLPLFAIGIATLATRLSPLLVLVEVTGGLGASEARWPLWQSCLAWAALGLVQSGASACSGRLTARLGPAGMLRLVWIAAALVFIALALLPGPWLILAGLGFGVVVGVGEGVEKTWIADRCQRTERARAFGALGLVTAATGLAGNALVGLVLQHHRLEAFLALAVVALLGTACTLSRAGNRPAGNPGS